MRWPGAGDRVRAAERSTGLGVSDSGDLCRGARASGRRRAGDGQCELEPRLDLLLPVVLDAGARRGVGSLVRRVRRCARALDAVLSRSRALLVVQCEDRGAQMREIAARASTPSSYPGGDSTRRNTSGCNSSSRLPASTVWRSPSMSSPTTKGHRRGRRRTSLASREGGFADYFIYDADRDPAVTWAGGARTAPRRRSHLRAHHARRARRLRDSTVSTRTTSSRGTDRSSDGSAHRPTAPASCVRPRSGLDTTHGSRPVARRSGRVWTARRTTACGRLRSERAQISSPSPATTNGKRGRRSSLARLEVGRPSYERAWGKTGGRPSARISRRLRAGLHDFARFHVSRARSQAGAGTRPSPGRRAEIVKDRDGDLAHALPALRRRPGNLVEEQVERALLVTRFQGLENVGQLAARPKLVDDPGDLWRREELVDESSARPLATARPRTRRRRGRRGTPSLQVCPGC